MNTVEITGLNQDFSKASCASTLCSVAKINLAEAKRIVDSVLEGNIQRIALTSEQDAYQLVEFLSMHGAISRVI